MQDTRCKTESCFLLLASCLLLSIMPRMDDKETTPIRKQYLDLKARSDTILFFRLGDFTRHSRRCRNRRARELASSHLAARLEGRNPDGGVPHHRRRLHRPPHRKGYRVAIAEQVGEPTSRGPMERRIDASSPRARSPSQRCSTKNAPTPRRRGHRWQRAGVAYAEISTGEFAATQLEADGDI